MNDDTPVDLAQVCNVGVQFIRPDAKAPLGNQSFHGLPFRIGNDPARPNQRPA
jgi:hypothetical protein